MCGSFSATLVNQLKEVGHGKEWWSTEAFWLVRVPLLAYKVKFGRTARPLVATIDSGSRKQQLGEVNEMKSS